MALKDLMAFIDDKLADTFNLKPHDPSKARARASKAVDTTLNQFESPTPTRGRKRFKIANNVVEYTPGYQIGGKDTVYIPSERFGEFLKMKKQAIEAGDFDDALAAQDGEAAPASNRGGAGKKRAGWSPERRAQHEARMAAKRAGK